MLEVTYWDGGWLLFLMLTLPLIPMDDVLTVVNEYSGATREQAGESALPYPPPAEIALGADWLTLLEPSLEELAAAADALHPIFATAPGQQRAAVLNSLLERSAPQPRSASDGTLGWEIDAEHDALLGALSVAVLRWGDQHGIHHLGVCAAERCTDIYADAAGRRRFCSSTCLSRTKVAVHRRRKAEATTPGSTSI